MSEPSPWKLKSNGARFDASYDGGIDSRYSRSVPLTVRCWVVSPGTADFPHPAAPVVPAPAATDGTTASPTAATTRSGSSLDLMRYIVGRLCEGDVKPGWWLVGNLRLDKG